MFNHNEIENEILTFYEREKIYEKILTRSKGKKTFYFCDGPPYATGHIHPGTAWNKIIKDAFCRYWRMRGFDVRTQPGYDTHGLPIEVKVEQQLGIKQKKEIESFGIANFIQKCKDFADQYITIMTAQFKRLGVWMDWSKPYITYYDDYIEASWKTLKQAYEQNLMHEGYYIVAYCTRCETTMANYELEYHEKTDPSIYVKFPIKERENEFLLIWTTTPWTLVANLAVMVNPKLTYVKVKVDNEIWYIAKDRLESIINLVKKSALILEELSGKGLEGIRYVHPFQNLIAKEYDRKVILSEEFVTTEEGTGLVHCAPGHGQEDFIIGKRYNLEIFSPVDDSGKYTKEAKYFEGKSIFEANNEIIEILKKNNLLLYEDRIKHRYPHCWRCKTPLIFRATNQWFITISKLKDRMLEEIEKIKWHPTFAKERFKDFVKQAPDWCISRQRYWGIPLPIWKCEKCGSVKVIGSKKELPNSGRDIKELHRPYVDEVILECSSCNGKMKRVEDVLDVWFDSGNAVWASLSSEDIIKFGDQADLIVEGQDQIRGWFYSLLGSGIIRYSKSPYKRVVMHGFFVDEKGEKMSKSLGNFVPIEEIIDKYGADSFRLWGVSNTVWEELKFKWSELKEANNDLNIFYNLFIFLTRFYPKNKIEKVKLSKEDLWLISRLNSTLKEYHSGFENYEINLSARALRYFLVEDLSRFYMKIAKERINSNNNAEGALYSIYLSVFYAAKMLYPFSPLIVEKVYQDFFKKFEKEESIAFFSLPLANESEIDKGLEKSMEKAKEVISAGLELRQKIGIKLRWPLRQAIIKIASDSARELKELSDVIKKLLNVKEVIFTESFSEDLPSNDFSNGKIYISKSIDTLLYEEGIYNEVKRRVQQLRKELSLIEEDKIILEIDCSEEIGSIVKKYEERLKVDTNTLSLSYVSLGDDSNEYEIDGKNIRLKITKVK